MLDKSENITRIEYKYADNARKIVLEQNDVISFLKGLDDESIDVIITDPAYSGMNKKLKLGRGRIVGKYSEKGQSEGKWFQEFDDTPENYHSFLRECRRVLKKDTGHIYLMFDSYSLLTLGALVRQYFDVKNLLVWDKVNIGMGHYYRRRHELILFATNGNTRNISSRSLHDIWEIKRIHGAKYPTQKPVEVFERMLEASAKSGFVVCDPFLGSGSSAIAAVKHQVDFYGCDISSDSIELSSRRVDNFIKENIDILEKKRRGK